MPKLKRRPSPQSSATKGDGRRYWIGVIPKSRVTMCVEAGVAMFAHGRHAPVKRVQPGDWLAYYSPRTIMNGGEEVRAFTAIGKIKDRDPYETEVAPGRLAWRRDIAYAKRVHDADVYPLLDQLSFIADRQHWGLAFHRSIFSVPRDDFMLIANAMGLDRKRL